MTKQESAQLVERSASLGFRDTANEPARRGVIRAAVRDIGEVLREIWEYRELLYQLSLRDIRIRYKQAVMGFAWAIFMPALIVMAGLMIKYIMARLAGGELQTAAIGAVAVKSIPWAFFVGSIGFATNSLVGNKSLITKIYFPREVFPVSATIAQSFDSAIGAIALCFVLPFLGAQLSLALLWVPPLALLLLMITVAVSFFLSCGNLFFRDVKYIVRVLLTFGIFFTPVFFEPVDLGALGAQLIYVNPLSPILEGLRLSVIEGHNLMVPVVEAGSGAILWTPLYLLYSVVWGVGGLVISSLLFHRLEFVFAEYV